MKQNIEVNYRGEIETIINKFPREDKKVIEDYISFRRTTASDDKCKQYRVKIIILRDITQTSFKKWDKDIIQNLLILIKNSERKDKVELKKVLKHFVDWKFDNSKLTKLIKAGTQQPNREKINKNNFPTDKEIEKMFLACKNLQEKAMLSVQEELGLRPAELLNLKWKDCKFEDNSIIIQINGTKSLNSVRVLPAKASYTHLLRYKKEYPYPDLRADDYVFPNPSNRDKPHQRQFLNHLYSRICNRAGIRHLNPYDMRHRRLTSIYEKTQDLLLTSKFGGHSLKVSSDFYQHSTANDIKDMIMEKVYNIEDLSPEKRTQLEKELERLKQDFGNKEIEYNKMFANLMKEVEVLKKKKN